MRRAPIRKPTTGSFPRRGRAMVGRVVTWYVFFVSCMQYSASSFHRPCLASPTASEPEPVLTARLRWDQ